MLAITHLVVTLFLIQVFVLDRNDAFVALVFGVLIDLDHLMGLKDYTDAHGFRALMDWDTLLDPGGHWKSMLHSPVAVAVIGPVSALSRLGIPLLFWSVHLVMDHVRDAYLSQFSEAEAMLLVFATLGLVTLRYSRYIEAHVDGSMMDYLRSEWRGLRSLSGPGTL